MVIIHNACFLQKKFNNKIEEKPCSLNIYRESDANASNFVVRKGEYVIATVYFKYVVKKIKMVDIATVTFDGQKGIHDKFFFFSHILIRVSHKPSQWVFLTESLR